MVWNTFSPIASLSKQYFGVSELAIDAFSLLYMVIYIPFVFLATFIINRQTLRVGIIIGACLNLLGTWIRYVGVIVSLKPIDQYYIVITGQTITALAQTFILQIPPLIANNWFAPKERAFATSIGALWNQFGIAIGFLISPLIVKGLDDISMLLLVMGIISAVAWLAAIVGFQSRPPTPPAASVLVERAGLQNSVSILFRNRSFVLLFLAFGMTTGGFYALTTLLEQIGDFAGYTPVQSGWEGFIIIVVGIVGAIFGGMVTDKWQKYKELLLIVYGGSFLSLVWLLFSITTRSQFTVLAVCCGVVGFFLTATLPPSLESVVEATYPVNEEVSSGLLMLSAQVFGIIFIVAMDSLLQSGMVHESCDLVVGAAGVSFVFLLFFEARYRRLEAEKEIRAGGTIQ